MRERLEERAAPCRLGDPGILERSPDMNVRFRLFLYLLLLVASLLSLPPGRASGGPNAPVSTLASVDS